MRKFFFLTLLLCLFLACYQPASAQASGPVYIVQSGDTLSSIASRFNISVENLMNANSLADTNIFVGQQLIIPGLEGVTGVLDTQLIAFGDSYRSLMRRTQISPDLFGRLNHIVSPTEFYVGASMIIPQQDNAPAYASMTPHAGESMLEMAVRNNTDVWTVSALNNLYGPWAGLPGDTLYAPGTTTQTASGLPSAFESATIPYLPIKQGGTGEIIIKTQPGVTLGGLLVDQPLHFFDMGDGKQVALQGVYVELDPGVYPLRLDATLPDGSKQSFEQMVLVKFGVDNPDLQYVPPMDPSILTSETQQITSIISTSTPSKYWQGQFILPVALPYCIKEWFGTPRYYTYNNADFTYFHGGIDYGVCSAEHPLDIYAAAAGKVVFTGSLPIRGNTTIIDNGWGVYTIYAHQSQIDVTVGQDVQAGDLIGQIGETGHVTGPHLHWEMWVNGVQVDPLEWLDQSYP